MSETSAEPKRKRGRPKGALPCRIHVKVSRENKDLLRQAAKNRGMSESEYVIAAIAAYANTRAPKGKPPAKESE